MKEFKKEAKLTIRLYEDDKEALRKIAEKQDVPMSQIIRKLIEKYIDKTS